MERDFQHEAFVRRHTGFSVRVIRLEDGSLAVLDHFDLLRGVIMVPINPDNLYSVIKLAHDNPPIYRPQPTRLERAKGFLKGLGL